MEGESVKETLDGYLNLQTSVSSSVKYGDQLHLCQVYSVFIHIHEVKPKYFKRSH